MAKTKSECQSNAVQPLPAKGFKAADISARYEEIVNRNGKKGNVG